MTPFEVFLVKVSVRIRPKRSLLSFRSGANFVAVRLPRWVPLSGSLQVSFCFFSHLLPSREFCLCYLGLTQEFDFSLRPCRAYPVVSTEVYRVVRTVVYFAEGVLFPHLEYEKDSKPTFLPFW